MVSERLGHSTIAITLDTYSHVLPGLQAAAAERLADLLDGERKATSEGVDPLGRPLGPPAGGGNMGGNRDLPSGQHAII